MSQLTREQILSRDELIDALDDAMVEGHRLTFVARNSIAMTDFAQRSELAAKDERIKELERLLRLSQGERERLNGRIVEMEGSSVSRERARQRLVSAEERTAELERVVAELLPYAESRAEDLAEEAEVHDLTPEPKEHAEKAWAVVLRARQLVLQHQQQRGTK